MNVHTASPTPTMRGDLSIEEMEQAEQLQCNAAGALWSIAADVRNQLQIASLGGITPLVKLLHGKLQGAQEAAAGVLHRLSSQANLRGPICDADAIEPLAFVLEHGNAVAKEQAAGCLSLLTIENTTNQQSVARQVVKIFSNGVPDELEHATSVARDLAMQESGKTFLDSEGATPHLVRQIAEGTDHGCDNSARALGKIALVSSDCRSTITHQLIRVRHESSDLRVTQRVSRALKEMDVGDEADSLESQQAVGLAILMFQLHERD